MTPPTEPGAAAARHWRSLWPGLVWAIPLAALIIVAYLGVQALAQRGVTVTVTFDRAAGARAGDTKVVYQGAEAGELVKIRPNKDGRRIDFVLRLLPEAKSGLNSNARFWLIGATPSLSDLSSLKAVVEGVEIGYAPGEGGTPTRAFEGLERAPIILPGDKGTRYQLQARSLGTVQAGSAVMFHGLSIGKVANVEFAGEHGFRLDVFVFQPYDSLVKPGASFWKSSPVRLSFAGGSVDANLAPASTLLTGAIDLDVPEEVSGQAQSPAGSEFTLYASQEAARQRLSGPAFAYDFAFDGLAGDLTEGSPITLLGFKIGEVETARLAYDPHTAKPFTAVTGLLYPRQLGDAMPPTVSASAAPAPESQAATDATLRALLHLGYRARLSQQPALVGATGIALVPTQDRAARLTYDGPHARIPSASGSGGLDDITSLADQILTKVNRIPIEAMGRDLKQVTGQLNSLVSSPELADSFEHLHSTLASLDQTLKQVQPQVGPLMTKLNDAAEQLSGTAVAARQLLDGQGSGADGSLQDMVGQLTAAARSIRGLADYLDRHPESLVRGKRPAR